MPIRRLVSILIAAMMMLLCCQPAAHAYDQGTDIQSAPMTYNSNTRSGMVRVYLSSLGSLNSLSVTVSGSYSVSGAQNMTLTSGETVHLSFRPATGEITMTRAGSTYSMGSEMVFRRHQTNGENGLRIAQAKRPNNLYPGDLQLKAQKSGTSWRLYPIVHVYIESYLHGVLPYEMGNSASTEALKAQAVAARTYTLNKMNTRTGQLYDVVDTTNDQVYYGNSDSTANCTAAVDATRGIVLMNDGKLTNTYYTASNGGQTESARNMWNSSSMSYLTVKDDPFDLMNPASVYRKATVYADHTASGQKESLKNLLNSKLPAALSGMGYASNGAYITHIRSITPHTPQFNAPSRLYTKMDFAVAVQTTAGLIPLTLTLDIFGELEAALGLSINATRNELWSVTASGDMFQIYARRFGHGVGMSQRGAMQMGSMGYTYDQILGFYYENSQRVQYSFTHTILAAIGSGGSTITNTDKPAEITGSQGCQATVRLAGIRDTLPIRYTADVQSTVLMTVQNGGLVSVLKKGDAWSLVQLGRVIGYVPTSSLSMLGTPPSDTNASPTLITSWATVTSSGSLNLRAAASTGAAVMSQIPSGAALCVFDVTGGWAQVQYGAQSGYVSTDFIRLTNAFPGPIIVSADTARVSIPSGSGTVNLRQTASTTGSVLTTIAHGEEVRIITNDGSWCQAAYGAYQGYIMASFLDFDGSHSVNKEESAIHEKNDQLEAIVQTFSTGLNLRTSPSTDAGIAAVIPRGEHVIVSQRGDAWCAVRYGSHQGYVMTEYLYFPSDGQQQVQAWATVNVSFGVLNMRSLPQTGSGVVTTIPRGARVGILRWDDAWPFVSYEGSTGYVSAAYLTRENDLHSTGAVAVVSTASGGLNLRETASAQSRILNVIPNGSVIEVKQNNGEWCHIQWMNHTGYVMTRYLTLADEQVNVSAWIITDITGGVNLRQQPSYQAAVLTTLAPGAQVTINGLKDAWYAVTYQGVNGYVLGDYITPTEPAPAVLTRYINTSSGGLNMRNASSTAAQILLSIPRGEAVTVQSVDGEWACISYANLTGYVMAQYLSEIPPSAITPGKTDSGHTKGVYDTTLVNVPNWHASVNVTTSLNIRQWCAVDAPIVASLANGTYVNLLQVGDTWCHINYEGIDGYCMTSYLTLLPAMP